MPKSLKPTITSNWMNLSVKFFIVFTSTCYFLFNGTQISKADEKTISIAQRLVDEGSFKAAHTELFQIDYLNNPEALNLLAQIYSEEKFGIDANKIEFYLSRASELGHTESMIDLGVFYEDGDILPESLDKTMQLYRKAHLLGDSRATYYLALNHQYGIGTNQDIDKAIEYYEEAINRGNEDATIDLGYLYVSEDFIEADYDKALQIFMPLAVNGVVDAQYNLGLMYENLEKYDLALNWYLKAHSQGFGDASYQIGELYFNELLPTDDKDKIAKGFYEKAAASGNYDAQYSLGWLYQYGLGTKQDLKKAAEYYEKAASSEDPYILNLIGLAYADYENPLFDKNKTRMYYETASDLGDFNAPGNLARSFNYFVNYPEFNKAFDLTQDAIQTNVLEARKWYRKSLDIGNFYFADEYAATYHTFGDLEKAKEIILETIKFSEEQDPPDIVMKTHMYSFLSYYFDLQGFEQEALRIMSLAINNIEENSDLFPPLTKAMSYRDYAALLNINSDRQEALKYYEIAEQIVREEDEPELLAPTLNGKAIVLENLGKYAEAIEMYYEALSYIEEAFQEGDSDLAMIYANLVPALVGEDRLDEALVFAKKSVQMVGPIYSGHPWHTRVISELAEVYERLGQKDNARIAHETASKLFSDRYFSSSPSDLTSMRIGEYYQQIHPVADAAIFFTKEYLRTGELDTLNKAFLNFQKSNFSSAEFEMARLSTRLRWKEETDRSSLKAYQILTDKISNTNFDLTLQLASQNIDRKNIKDLEETISNLQIKRKKLSKDIFSNETNSVPNYENRFLSIEQVQEQLSANQILIYPAMTFSDTPITILTISKNNVKVSTSKLTAEEIRERSEELRKSLQFKNAAELSAIPEFDTKLSIELFDILLGESLLELEAKTDIIFVPTWPISNLPLSVLIINGYENGSAKYKNYRWLGLEKNISYVTAIGDFQENSNRKENIKLSSFLGIGDPLLGPSNQSLRGLNFVDTSQDDLKKSFNIKSLPSLPATGLEIKFVQKIFPESETSIFLGSEATERNLKEIDTSKFKVISFATHGLMANEWENLDEPALVLTPTPNDSAYDGLLTASEIRELNFNADLIVLSACNTAAGDGESDEGLSGLASAFIFAGAKSVMASHWSIESNTTKNLMSNFFYNLTSDRTSNKAEALRLAMKEIASQEQFSHPIFWAPFVLVGQQ